MNRFAIVAVTAAFAISALGQAPFKPLTGPVPRTADGKPDLSGVWQTPFVPDMTKDARNQKGTAELPFAEWGANNWKNYHAEDGDYTGACLPWGLPRSVNAPAPMHIMQSSKYVTFLFEQGPSFHVVPVDGRGHRNQSPTWAGDSIGHWEGDTLVVDTVNFNGKTRMDTIGHPHSDQLHLTQRYTRTDLGHIAFEMIVEDPKAYTKPWKNTRTFILRPDWELMEFSCEENNKNLWEGRIKVPKY